MFTKLVEVAIGTDFIPCIAIRLQPVTRANQRLIADAGYGKTPTEQSEYVLFAMLAGGPMRANPHDWSIRTLGLAHRHVIAHWDTIVSGDTIAFPPETIPCDSTTP